MIKNHYFTGFLFSKLSQPVNSCNTAERNLNMRSKYLSVTLTRGILSIFFEVADAYDVGKRIEFACFDVVLGMLGTHLPANGYQGGSPLCIGQGFRDCGRCKCLLLCLQTADPLRIRRCVFGFRFGRTLVCTAMERLQPRSSGLFTAWLCETAHYLVHATSLYAKLSSVAAFDRVHYQKLVE